MRNFFEPVAGAPSWLKQVLTSIRAALGDIWPAPLRLKDYATADLPTAAEFGQGLVYDSSVPAVKWSDGADWRDVLPSFPGQASENLAAGALCNLYTSGGALRVRNANATDTTKPAHAFVKAAALSGANATLYFAGQVVTGLAGLTPGTTYFLATTNGAVTATPPSADGNGVQEVGVALSASSMLFQPKVMIGL